MSAIRAFSASAARPQSAVGSPAGPAHPLRRPARGASSLLLLMILVTLGGLTVHTVGLVTAALGDNSRALSHERAMQAAAAGLEWGRFRVSTGAAALCTPVQSINTLPGTLRAYTVTVRCTVAGPFNEGAAVRRLYRLSAVACLQAGAGGCPAAAAGADYVQARVVGVVER
jgi:MSHA biogenesis protein MshP